MTKNPTPPSRCRQGHTHQVTGCGSCTDLIRAWKRWTGTN